MKVNQFAAVAVLACSAWAAQAVHAMPNADCVGSRGISVKNGKLIVTKPLNVYADASAKEPSSARSTNEGYWLTEVKGKRGLIYSADEPPKKIGWINVDDVKSMHPNNCDNW